MGLSNVEVGGEGGIPRRATAVGRLQHRLLPLYRVAVRKGKS